MKLTDKEAQTLIDELIAQMPPERQPGDIDAKQFAEQTNMSAKAATTQLDKFAELGTLVKMKVRGPTGTMNVWRKAV